MDGLWLEWLVFAVRWFHVIAAIAWIGASFYFIWLDQSLVAPGAEKAARGLKGELWAIHGGGIYEVGKYRLAPPRMPERLHWFKWEAYTTWLSGFALLMALYYVRADTYMIGAATWVQTPLAAIVCSLIFLTLLFLLYEGALRTRLLAYPVALAAVITVGAFGASVIAWQLFSPRAAALHVGAALATIMAGNVFLGIIPAQKKLVAAIAANVEPDPAPAELAKLRSTHNNYLTLPVLICMLSNHAPFLYAHPSANVLLPALMVLAALGRHFFNLRNRGIYKPQWLVGSITAYVAIVILAAYESSTAPARSTPDAAPEVAPLLQAHCANCHSARPTHPGFASAPGGLLFVDPQDLRANANGISREQIVIALSTGYMPLGNQTQLAESDRARLIAWITQSP
ncbi:MAG: urate hydroxylase PuuD [Pseudomonadales bacterium]